MDTASLTKAFRVLNDTCKELDRTILYGWPHDRLPTDEQAVAIESTYNELSLHYASMDLPEHDRWHLAGQLVARIERDRSSSGEHARPVATPSPTGLRPGTKEDPCRGSRPISG